MGTHTKLTSEERDKLAIWKAQGASNRECGRKLSRHPSTIGRELRRNSLKDEYVSIHAEQNFLDRQQNSAHNKHPLKNKDVYEYALKYLRKGWSPEQIAGRMEKEHPNDDHWRIVHETIYQWIYQPEQVKRDDPWYEYLRRRQKKRKKQRGRTVHRSHIPDRISIHSRSLAANERKEFGHWKGDTVEGKGRMDGIHTEVERMSRLLMGEKITSITSRATIIKQKAMFAKLPERARKSDTLDNGKENHLHYELRELGMETFFADPYSSWQRGTNEHGNWHLRYYIPKGTYLSQVSDEELHDIIEEINNRPRKILGYQTARERFDELLLKT